MAGRARTYLANVAVALTVVCALVTTGLVIRREFLAGDTRTKHTKQVSDSVWQALTGTGHRLGPQVAPLTVVVFADFQCPACRAFLLGPLAQVRRQFEGQVSVVFRHWPLQYHSLAMPTAIASECAAAQGAFQEFHDLAFAKQDSLALKPLVLYALESGVRDTIAFKDCMSSPLPKRAIERDVAAATSIGAVGTPTVIANNRQYVGYPAVEQLVELIKDGS